MTKEDREFFTNLINEHRDDVSKRLGCFEKKLLDPDNGLFARVQRNTQWRKGGQWVLGLLLSGIFLGLVAQVVFG